MSSNGTWDCQVPATSLDIVLRAKTYIPHYKWDVLLKPDEPVNLANLKLRRAASLVAWLDSATVTSLKAPATARLLHMTTGDPSAASYRLSQPVAEEIFNARGVVQLTSIAPGKYVLDVTAQGFAPARIGDIEVYENSESAIRRPISLGPPVPISVSITPPRDPSGEPWRVTLFHTAQWSSRSSQVAEGVSNETGLFSLRGQAPGKYSVTVRDAKKNIYAKRDFVVPTETDVPQHIVLSLARVGGVVKLADRPVAATLLFGGGSGAQRITATTDEEGRFSATLPHTGMWVIDVRAREEAVLATVKVPVEKDDDEIEIDLPDTEISGWVSGPAGNRVGAAEVTMLLPAGVISRRAESDGTFVIRGVAPGTFNLLARDLRTGEESRSMEVSVEEGGRAANIELILESLRDLRGLVVSRGQPVIGARVTGYGFIGGEASQERAVTDVTGEFSLAIPANATRIVLVVAAAGRTLQAFAMPGTDDQVRLELAPAGGTVRFDLPRNATNHHVAYNGILIPFTDLMQWAHAQGKPLQFPLEVPHLAPGDYRLCAIRPEGQQCREGTLATGALLDLSLK